MKRYKKYIHLTLFIIFGILLTFYGFTYAKYISNSIWNYYLKTVGFYFNSDNLGITAVKNVDNLWDGESVYFNIKNNLNQTVINDTDIAYEVTCTITGEEASYTTCHMNGTSSNIYVGTLPNVKVCINNTTDAINVSEYDEETCKTEGYNWTSQISTQDLFFDVVLTNQSYQISDIVVNITVMSTSPYKKSLIGDFTLHKRNIEDNNVGLNYKNYSNYDRLIISNSNTNNKCVKITWDASKLKIDANTNEFSAYNVDVNGYINEIKFNINAKDNLSYIFYKSDFDQTYNVNEFIIVETTGCV